MLIFWITTLGKLIERPKDSWLMKSVINKELHVFRTIWDKSLVFKNKEIALTSFGQFHHVFEK